VPEFCPKDVPLAKLLSLIAAGKVVFDPLAARYETKIVDWRRKRADSPAAWWNRMIDAAAFRLSDLVLADTAGHKDYYCRMYGLDRAKVEVLPLGYDDEIFRMKESAPRADSGPFSVLFFGSFLPLHGAEVIVDAARIVAGRAAGVRFILIGEGQTLPAAKAAAESAGLANVEFRGRMPARELPSAIAKADLCLGIFGRTEKARRVVPHKVFQSMALGKAVVTARTPAVEEFFADGETIVLCDEPLAESLAEAVLNLKRDPALRDRIARNGFALVRRDHSPEAVARRLVALLRRHFG
jgi:glycosyltransferase involved in cell wall biosynthesis